jgi:hypothetical protein
VAPRIGGGYKFRMQIGISALVRWILVLVLRSSSKHLGGRD